MWRKNPGESEADFRDCKRRLDRSIEGIFGCLEIDEQKRPVREAGLAYPSQGAVQGFIDIEDQDCARISCNFRLSFEFNRP